MKPFDHPNVVGFRLENCPTASGKPGRAMVVQTNLSRSQSAAISDLKVAIYRYQAENADIHRYQLEFVD
jgi:hypothetical protein